jgi:hypothetical protein
LVGLIQSQELVLDTVKKAAIDTLSILVESSSEVALNQIEIATNDSFKHFLSLALNSKAMWVRII